MQIFLFSLQNFSGLVPWARQQQKQLHESGVPRFRIPLLFLRAMYKEKRLLGLGLAVCAIFMLQVVFAGVVATSIASATTFLFVQLSCDRSPLERIEANNL